MLTIIGALLGLLGSLAPEILKFFNQKKDQQHEREMYKLQMEGWRLQGDIKLAEINATADVAETTALYKSAEIKMSGWKFIDGLISLYNSSVRPTITYLFMGTYILVKYAIYSSYTTAGYSWTQAIQTIWNQEDFAVFSTVISFYFGARFLKYSLGRIKS